MLGNRVSIIIIGFFICLFFPQERARSEDIAPSPELLQKLAEVIKEDPKNLDNYFNYAQVATAMGELEEAIQAYQYMLSVDASLHRVKLDLALLYTRTGRFKDASILFHEVLDTHPPDEVVRNINLVLKEVNAGLERHKFSGAVTLGYNYDSNANSAPKTNAITFIDISLPLEGQNRQQVDGQYFGAAVLNYRYRTSHPPENTILDWNVRGTTYSSYQQHVANLDIGVLGVKAGPTLELQRYKTKISLEGGYQWVQLDYYDYLNMASLDLTTSYRYSDEVTLYSVLTYEDRNFINSPRSNTFSDRSGDAYQVKLGFSDVITNKDVAGASLTYRRENTRQDFLDNDQIDAAGSYTHQFTDDIFINVFAGQRWSFYDGPDVFVSATTTREDREAYSTLTFGKKIMKDTVLTFGYQYRHVSSTIQNYAYDNHRITTTVGWSF